MNALDYPEILEALENGTIPSRSIGGIVAWISNETGLHWNDAYINFRNEIIALSEGYFIYEAQESGEQKGNESSKLVANKEVSGRESSFCICCKTTILARKL